MFNKVENYVMIHVILFHKMLLRLELFNLVRHLGNDPLTCYFKLEE